MKAATCMFFHVFLRPREVLVSDGLHRHLGSIYTGPDPFRTGTKLVRISLVFTRDLVDPVWIGSAIWYQMGSLMKVFPYETIPFQFQTSPV